MISGDLGGDIDIDDLTKNVNYHGYKDGELYIKEFWRILKEDLSPEEREKFMIFVTGTNRPPLLGFKYLSP